VSGCQCPTTPLFGSATLSFVIPSEAEGSAVLRTCLGNVFSTGARKVIPSLNLTLAYIAQRTRSDLFGPPTTLYLDRIAPYAGIESVLFRDEESLFAYVTRQRARTPAWLALLDSRGEALSSEELAAWLGARRDSGQQRIVFAIGPASGWSERAPRQAQAILSLGRMTLPHELARLVLAEQLYRAFTILGGHPYHTGH
jgi:23S rRNA (pseudouridine1915-N3)-methyltransferase